jgi:hypothetical protein
VDTDSGASWTPIPAHRGDGLVVGAEVCDGENLQDQTCEALGLHSGELDCSTMCVLDTANCGGQCGDNEIQPLFEDCDGAALGGETSETQGLHPGELGCSSTCTFDTVGCGGLCGDGEIQPLFEDCEGFNLGNESCHSLGYYGGSLGCDAICRYDFSGCLRALQVAAGDRHTCLLLDNGTCLGSG